MQLISMEDIEKYAKKKILEDIKKRAIEKFITRWYSLKTYQKWIEMGEETPLPTELEGCKNNIECFFALLKSTN